MTYCIRERRLCPDTSYGLSKVTMLDGKNIASSESEVSFCMWYFSLSNGICAKVAGVATSSLNDRSYLMVRICYWDIPPTHHGHLQLPAYVRWDLAYLPLFNNQFAHL